MLDAASVFVKKKMKQLKNYLGKFLIVVGCLCILGGMLIYIYNKREDNEAGKQAALALVGVQEGISRKDWSKSIVSGEGPLIEFDGYQYIGYLTVSALELTLPVMSEWDYNRLKIAPCRHFGSAQTNDLVIAGHNYKQHFANLKNLSTGDSITFTDGNGIVYEYSVQLVEKIPPTSVNEVQNSEWDMILYTCTYGGNARLMVGCQRTNTILPDNNE